ncbi:MAG: hypothetical protein ABH864_06290 [archaeon]
MKKELVVFLIILFSTGLVSSAVVSHKATEVLMPDGITTLAQVVPSGAEICTNVNGKCPTGKWSSSTIPGDIYYSGDVGIGTSTPQAALNIAADGTSQMWITGKTNPNQRLYIGYNTISNYGSIPSNIIRRHLSISIAEPKWGKCWHWHNRPRSKTRG